MIKCISIVQVGRYTYNIYLKKKLGSEIFWKQINIYNLTLNSVENSITILREFI